MLNQILKAIDTAGRWMGTLAVASILGIAILITFEVISRWLLDKSITFAWEYSSYFFSTSVFCGAAFTMRTGGHVRVSMFNGLAGPRTRYAMELVSTLLGAGISIFVAYAMIFFAWRSFVQGSVSPTINATPLVIPQGAIALGLLMLALQMIARVIRVLIKVPTEDEAAKESFNVN